MNLVELQRLGLEVRREKRNLYVKRDDQWADRNGTDIHNALRAFHQPLSTIVDLNGISRRRRRTGKYLFVYLLILYHAD